MRLVLLTKSRPVHDTAEMLTRAVFPNLTVIRGKGRVEDLVGCDWLVSFYGSWVVPAKGLSQPRCGAINIHPGSPEYPGFACYNLALYEHAPTYGVTTHFMAPRVDTGAILFTRSVPIYSDDSVLSLQQRTEAVALGSLVSLLDNIRADSPILRQSHPLHARSLYTWKRPPSTRADLDRLRRVSPTMSSSERDRRHRAITYPGLPGLIEEVA